MDESCSIQTLPFSCIKMRNRYQNLLRNKSLIFGGHLIKKSFPFFVLFFILASVVTTIFHLPAAVTGPLKELSKFLIVMAMAAIGLNTNIVHLVKTGAKPIFTGFCCWVGISLVSLGMQHMMGLW